MFGGMSPNERRALKGEFQRGRPTENKEIENGTSDS